MKKYFIILFIINLYPNISFSLSYDCEIVHWGSTSKNLKTWLPERFILNPDDKNITVNTPNWYKTYPAEIIVKSKTRLELFFYDNEASTSSGQKSDTNKYVFTYLPIPNKVVLTMHTPGYLPTKPVSGKCKELSIGVTKKSSTSNSQNQNSSDFNTSTRDPNPVIFLENELLYGEKFEFPSQEDEYLNNSESKIDKAKKDCSEIGYKIGTEKFADCVMKLIEG